MAGGESYADVQAEIERMRRSLAEVLKQQTATSEVLWVIASSLTHLGHLRRGQ